MRLAARSGFSEVDLVYVRWGAMLHDVGKMAVPDSVLGKRAPLDEREQAIMRRHPVYAYELLSPVEFLRPALDIPYCHHERWDGCGYPRGLVGQQIPLAARIFAVVDVWDALRSDRPYRAELTESAARQIIETSAGSLFDSDVVNLFLAMLDRRNGCEPEAVKAIDDAARAARFRSYLGEVKAGRFTRRERRSDAVMKVLEACVHYHTDTVAQGGQITIHLRSRKEKTT